MSAFRWTCEWARIAHLKTVAKLETGSTNADAKSMLDELESRALIVADHQTEGRGRGDHRWTEAPGQSLLSSWIFKLDKPAQPTLSPLIGLAVYQAAKKAWPDLPWTLKAPNDLHVVDRKIAGLLLEIVSGAKGHHLIVGLGFNLHGAPSGTAPYTATSLLNELAAMQKSVNESDWRVFLNELLFQIDSHTHRGPELSTEERASLLTALASHPEHKGLTAVAANGDLHFGSRIVSWSQL